MARQRRRRGGPNFKQVCHELGISTGNTASGGHSYRQRVETVFGPERGRVSKTAREALVTDYYTAQRGLRRGGDRDATVGLLVNNARQFPADFVKNGLETCITDIMGRDSGRALQILGRWKDQIGNDDYVRETVEGHVNRTGRRNASSMQVLELLAEWKPYMTQDYVDRMAERQYNACLRASDDAMGTRRRGMAPEAIQARRNTALEAVEASLAGARQLGVARADTLERGYMEHCMNHLQYGRMLAAADRIGMSDEEKIGYKMRAASKASQLAVRGRITEGQAASYITALGISDKCIREGVMQHMHLEVAKGRRR